MTVGEGAGRPEAAAAIWRWRQREIERAREASRARRGGLIQALVGAVVGGAFAFFGAHHVAVVAVTISAVVALLALLSPLGAFRRLDSLARAGGRLVGVVLAWLLLFPVFVLFFVPFGLLLRRGDRDRLSRRLERSSPSYWKKITDDQARQRFERPY